MSYLINKTNGDSLVVLADGTIDTSTSLSLVGRNYVGYGEVQNENFVFLLENFANDGAPTRPLTGQTWYDTDTGILKVYDGSSWQPIGTATLSITEPVDPANGSLWLKTPDNQLYVWQNTEWVFIGPEGITGYGLTKAKSTTLDDASGGKHPVILLYVDGTVIGICSKDPFTIGTTTPVIGFTSVVSGITLSSSHVVSGNLNGLADRATKLQTARMINEKPFDGTADILIQASTWEPLEPGEYIKGTAFDGNQPRTWDINATSANVIGSIVARNDQGGFAAGMITANLTGNVTGNVTTITGTSTFNIVEAVEFRGATLTGNAFSASKLAIARTINGIPFDGLTNITVPANAQTLTGTYINSTVLDSSLRSVGTLVELAISDNKITIGNSTLNTSPQSGTIATQEYVQTSGRNSQGTKTVQPISAGVPSNAIGVDGDIIYQY
jgi:hypothetical protein